MNRIAIVALPLLAASGAAWAAPGDHIRAGDVGIAPRVDLGAEVRTNVYRDEATAIPGANLRLAPGVLILATGEDHDFRTDAQWVLRKYFFLADNDLPPSQTNRVNNLDRFDEYSLGVGHEPVPPQRGGLLPDRRQRAAELPRRR